MLLPKSWPKKIKSHTIAEPVILPGCCKIVNIMFGEEYEKEMLKIYRSDNTVGWHIQDMPQDIESQVIANIKVAGSFAIQLDESTDHCKSSTPSIQQFYL
jgi:hypothetical protein